MARIIEGQSLEERAVLQESTAAIAAGVDERHLVMAVDDRPGAQPQHDGFVLMDAELVEGTLALMKSGITFDLLIRAKNIRGVRFEGVPQGDDNTTEVGHDSDD